LQCLSTNPALTRLRNLRENIAKKSEDFSPEQKLNISQGSYGEP
jgi:hypothetical protein